MRTARSLKANEPLLVGKLCIGEGFHHEPVLLIDAWCPYCKRHHHHGGEDELRHVSHRVAHCGPQASPFATGGYYIGCDPACRKENAQMLRRYKELHHTWELKQRNTLKPPIEEETLR